MLLGNCVRMIYITFYIFFILSYVEQKFILYLYTSNKQQYQMKVKVSRNHKVFPVSDN